jgi:hypothetical protein
MRFDALSLGDCYRLFEGMYFRNVDNRSPRTRRVGVGPEPLR